MWLQYYLDNDFDSVIFCEKGDDIQIVNNKTNSKIIIQIKCYSNNISFNSQEVEKALIRFYSLFDRTYETIFLFDTNAKINENDTILLNWVNNQYDLRPDLLKEFINAVRPKIWADIAKKKITVSKKNAIFNILNADLENFVKNIRWYFDNNNETEVAVNKLVLENIELIKKIDNLKFPIEKFFSVLYQEIVKKSIAKLDENTKLDCYLLKELITNCENDIDKFVDNEILTKINKVLNENQITHRKLDEHKELLFENKEILKKLDEKTDKILGEVTENKTIEKSVEYNSHLSNFSTFLNSGDLEFKSRKFENALINYLTAIKHKDCQDKRKNYLQKQIELCKIEIQAEKLLNEGIEFLKIRALERILS